MAIGDKIISFIGSKWFVLLLGIVMIVALPFTWHNVQVVFKFGQVSKFWWIIGVFACNLLAVGFCAYKFLSLITSKPIDSREEW